MNIITDATEFLNDDFYDIHNNITILTIIYIMIAIFRYCKIPSISIIVAFNIVFSR